MTATVFVSALVLGCAAIVLAVTTGTLRPRPLLDRLVPLPEAASAEAFSVDNGPAPLTVQTEPPGARVVLDGRARGRTPLQIHTSIGRHAVLLEADDSISMSEPVDVTINGSVLDVALWTRHPTVNA